MKPSARALIVLLCLLLLAKAGVGAMLSVTGAAGYGQPEPDDCPFVDLAAFDGAHPGAAPAAAGPPATDEPASAGAVEPGTPPLHHHHFCPNCAMQATVPTLITLPKPAAATAPVSPPAPESTVVLAPPIDPPRPGG